MGKLLKIVLTLALLPAIAFAQQPDDDALLGPAVDTSTPSSVSESAPTVDTSRRASRAIDEIELDTTAITGNQELPQVLYIVPWKASDLGDLVGRPVNTLLDEVLAPADREVLKRQIRYYEDLQPSGASE